MKRHDSRAPLSYIELYPEPVKTETAPPLWAQALGVIVAAAAIYALIVFTFSL